MSDAPIVFRSRLRLQTGGDETWNQDFLAVEEPLEICIGERAITVTMRTPGQDLDLVAGFLLTEGIVRSSRELGAIRHCAAEQANVVQVFPAAGVEFDLERVQRSLPSGTSCGLCGKVAIKRLRTVAPERTDNLRIQARILIGLPSTLRRAQVVFEKTGGLQAAGIFDADGRLLVAREDVGRHNAVDKAIGAMFLSDRIPLHRQVLLVSGRASFEIIQKACMASIPVVASVSAPSSLAVDAAKEFGITLVGFVRENGMSLYTAAKRVVGGTEIVDRSGFAGTRTGM